jgi:hypothetical protein
MQEALNALAFAKQVAPPDAHKAFDEMYSIMRDEGTSETRIIIEMLATTLDGLRYGNWPQ